MAIGFSLAVQRPSMGRFGLETEAKDVKFRYIGLPGSSGVVKFRTIGTCIINAMSGAVSIRRIWKLCRSVTIVGRIQRTYAAVGIGWTTLLTFTGGPMEPECADNAGKSDGIAEITYLSVVCPRIGETVFAVRQWPLPWRKKRKWRCSGCGIWLPVESHPTAQMFVRGFHDK